MRRGRHRSDHLVTGVCAGNEGLVAEELRGPDRSLSDSLLRRGGSVRLTMLDAGARRPEVGLAADDIALWTMS